MDTRYFSIVGYSGSGKTSLIEKIVKFLVNKSYKVGVIKSMHHSGFGIDIKDKDTTKYGNAGAVLISYIAPESSGIIYKKEKQQIKIFKLIENEVDYVILEGFTKIDFIPQIALIKDKDDVKKFVNNNTVGINSYHIDVKDNNLYIDSEKIPELVEKLAYPHIPLLNCKKCGYNSCADFYQNFLKGNTDLNNCVVRNNDDIKVHINDKIIPLNKFASKMIKNTIKGVLKSLTRSDDIISDIEIKIKL